MRLDQLLVERGLAESRARAQALILAGQVRVSGRDHFKAGMTLPADAPLEVLAPLKWVSRGGDKLEGALEDFGLAGRLAGAWLDCGASTGGFTQVLLENGVSRVYAMDVGYGQLAPRLAQDPRVTVIDRFNLREITPAIVPPPLAGVTLDLSFISARLVLPLLPPFLAPAAPVILLFKPQFEAERREVGKGGVIRDEAVRRRVRERFAAWLAENGWRIERQAESRRAGQKGNRETFLRLTTT